MAGLAFTVPVAGAACTDVAKSIIGLKAPANQAVVVDGFFAGFSGVDATKGPATVEICSTDWGANSPGTNSTSVTPAKVNTGDPETIQSTAGKSWSTEPTTLTVVHNFYIPTCMGNVIVYYPLSKPMRVKGGYGCVMRITLPSGVTVNFTGEFVCTE